MAIHIIPVNQNDPLWKIGDIAHRVRLCRRSLDVIIETDIDKPGIPHLPGQCRLAALAGASISTTGESANASMTRGCRKRDTNKRFSWCPIVKPSGG